MIHRVTTLQSSYLSSPLRALSIASGSFDLSRSCVTPGDPRHRVESRLITVLILGLLLVSGVADMDPGVDSMEEPRFRPPANDSLCNRSFTRPCWARGAGSTPFLVKRSASEAKHLRAPSATCGLQCRDNEAFLSIKHILLSQQQHQCTTCREHNFTFC